MSVIKVYKKFVQTLSISFFSKFNVSKQWENGRVWLCTVLTLTSVDSEDFILIRWANNSLIKTIKIKSIFL